MAVLILFLAALPLIGLIFYFFYWLQSRTYTVFKKDLQSLAVSLGLDLVEQKNPKWAYFNGKNPFLKGRINNKTVLILLKNINSTATNSFSYVTEIKISCALKNQIFIFCPTSIFSVIKVPGLKKIDMELGLAPADWTFGAENEKIFSSIINDAQFWENYVVKHEAYWKLEKGFLTGIVRNFPNSKDENFASLLNFGLELSDRLSKIS